MNKTLLGFVTATSLAVSLLAAPPAAQARCFGCAVGVGVAAGVIAGAVGELETGRTGRPGKVALKRDIGKCGIGAVIGIRRAENAIEIRPEALQIEEIAEIRREII